MASVIKYTILKDGEVVHQNLSEEDFFNVMEDLAQQFYESTDNNNPTNPYQIVREIVEE